MGWGDLSLRLTREEATSGPVVTLLSGAGCYQHAAVAKMNKATLRTHDETQPPPLRAECTGLPCAPGRLPCLPPLTRAQAQLLSRQHLESVRVSSNTQQTAS